MLLICLEDNCANVCCFVLYSLNWHTPNWRKRKLQEWI